MDAFNATVQVMGDCYRPADVNYWLWGYANRLCWDAGFGTPHNPPYLGDHTLAQAHKLAILYRSWGMRWALPWDRWGLIGRLAWTTAGYRGLFSAPAAQINKFWFKDGLYCYPCDKSYTGTMRATIGQQGTAEPSVSVVVRPQDWI